MAICQDCRQEMRTASSCTVDVMIMRGERFERRRVVTPAGPTGRCSDCGAQRGGFHHVGCDIEPCPRCGGQWLSCGCSWATEDVESLVLVAEGVVVHPQSLAGVRVSDARFPFDAPAPPSTDAR